MGYIYDKPFVSNLVAVFDVFSNVFDKLAIWCIQYSINYWCIWINCIWLFSTVFDLFDKSFNKVLMKSFDVYTA